MKSVFEQSAQQSDGGAADEGQSQAFAQARELMLSRLYEGGAAEGIARALMSSPSPSQGIVDQSMALADAMEQATQGSVPDEEVMSFVLDIVQEVVEIGQSTGAQISNRDIAEAVREVLAQVVENLGGDSQGIRAEMGQIDPEQVAMAAEQAEA